MRSSVSVFSEPGAYRKAMRMEGVADIALTRYGGFHARLTQVTLDHLRLFTVKENLPRIACFSVPKGDALIALSLGGGPAPIWGGVTAQPDNLITLGPGARAHMRTDGPSHWAAIWFPINDFARYSHALMGKVPTLPGIVCCWQPAANTGRSLRHILTDVMRAAQTRPDALTVAEAAHGLDQQLIHLLIEGLSGRPLDGNIPMRRRRHELMDQFEELLTSGLSGEADIAEIGGMLGGQNGMLMLNELAYFNPDTLLIVVSGASPAVRESTLGMATALHLNAAELPKPLDLASLRILLTQRLNIVCAP